MDSKSDFREAFIRRVDEDPHISLAGIARETGVSKSQLEKLYQRKSISTNIYDAVRIARYFGCTVEEFVGDPPKSSIDEIMSRIRALSKEEQAALLERHVTEISRLLSRK